MLSTIEKISKEKTGGITLLEEAADIRAAQAGEAEAFARLAGRHYSFLANHLRKFSANPTIQEDLLQETFLEAYLSLRSFGYRGSLRNWLRCIATRVGYRHWAACAREQRGLAAYVTWAQCDEAARFTVGIEEREDIGMLMQELEGIDQEILSERYLRGVRLAEIAHRLGWAPERVRVRVHRALTRLRRFKQGA